jgi:hypothetical protein
MRLGRIGVAACERIADGFIHPAAKQALGTAALVRSAYRKRIAPLELGCILRRKLHSMYPCAAR